MPDVAGGDPTIQNPPYFDQSIVDRRIVNLASRENGKVASVGRLGLEKDLRHTPAVRDFMKQFYEAVT